MPGRHLNDLERQLKRWWDANNGPSLRSIEIIGGARLRGFSNFTIDFRYPLVVLAGKNGTGKSTILACATCAYQNRGTYTLWLQGGKYFTFTDFFVTTSQDTPLVNVEVQWTYRREDRTVDIQSVIKGASRWRGYGKRPDRAVEFVGLIRALHPTELRALRNRFGTGSPATLTSLDISHKNTVSQIINRTYENVQVGSSGKHFLHFLHADGICYSGFNMGSGEDVACELTEIIHALPPRSLLVIEELETGLHPAAQRRLVRQLLQLCWDKKLQIICSSHSQTVMESVPADALVLLVREGTNLLPRYGVTVNEAISDMIEQPRPELAVYVEDTLAKTLVEESLPAVMRTRVRITHCGSWQDVIRFLAVYRKDTGLGHAVGILDGDRREKENEHLDTFKNSLGGNLNDNDKEWLQKRLIMLPGTTPPEVYLRQIGITETGYRERAAQQLNADVTALNDFFSVPLSADHHNLGYDLGQRVGLDPSRVEIALCKAAAECRASDFESLRSFLSARLGAAD
jgi:hypothetical protein